MVSPVSLLLELTIRMSKVKVLSKYQWYIRDQRCTQVKTAVEKGLRHHGIWS